MKIIKNHNLCFKVGDNIRIKYLKDLECLYQKINMSQISSRLYGSVHRIKSIEYMETLDQYRRCRIQLSDISQTVYPFELEHYEDNK